MMTGGRMRIQPDRCLLSVWNQSESFLFLHRAEDGIIVSDEMDGAAQEPADSFNACP